MKHNDVPNRRPRCVKPFRCFPALVARAAVVVALGACLGLASCGGGSRNGGGGTPPALLDGLVWDVTAPPWDSANWQ